MIKSWLPLVSGPGVSAPLRVGTQNLGFDEHVRASSLAGDIARLYRLDIFAMQEIYRWPHGADDHTPDLMAQVRASLPGWHFHEGPPGEWMVNLTASRLPIVAAHTERIEERHLLLTTVQTADGPLTICNWHAKRDNSDGRNACRYNRAAFEHIRRHCAGKPFVLVGDLNASVARLFGECNAGAETLIRRNPESYAGADFHAGLCGPEVVKVSAEGNVYGLVDAHELTVAVVRLSAASVAQREREALTMDDYGNDTQPERIGIDGDDLIAVATQDALSLEQLDALTARLAFVEDECDALKARVAELERIVRGAPKG